MFEATSSLRFRQRRNPYGTRGPPHIIRGEIMLPEDMNYIHWTDPTYPSSVLLLQAVYSLLLARAQPAQDHVSVRLSLLPLLCQYFLLLNLSAFAAEMKNHHEKIGNIADCCKRRAATRLNSCSCHKHVGAPLLKLEQVRGYVSSRRKQLR